MRHQLRLGLGVAAMLGLGVAGCNRTPTTNAEPAQRPYASIQELMLNVIDPTADELWDAVSAKYTKTGSVIKEPHTEEEWAALRRHALILAEAPNLLIAKDRPVAVEGGKIADEGSPGILTTYQIQQAIAADPERFATAAHSLQEAAKKMVQAIDRKDVPGVELVGSEIDEACETCHMQYWYPAGQAPK